MASENRAMNVSGLAASQYQSSTQQLSESTGHRRQHGGHGHASLADIDAQSSSLVSAPSTTGRVGSKLDVSV
jgi:hypothetical protein